MQLIECSVCGNLLSCQLSAECWCNTYPKIFTPNSAETCLCPNCLEIALAKKVQSSKAPLTDKLKTQIAAMGEPDKLIEGLHYTMETIAGRQLMVLSNWYLLRRGYCCENGCKNCPYT